MHTQIHAPLQVSEQDFKRLDTRLARILSVSVSIANIVFRVYLAPAIYHGCTDDARAERVTARLR